MPVVIEEKEISTIEESLNTVQASGGSLLRKKVEGTSLAGEGVVTAGGRI